MAMEMASKEDFDLFLSDLGLPDGSPAPVMKKVARRSGAVGIALTGFGMEKDMKRSKEFGFSYHLVKPVDVGRLTEILEQCRETVGG